jgi:hypothetical protein
VRGEGRIFRMKDEKKPVSKKDFYTKKLKELELSDAVISAKEALRKFRGN